MNLLITGGAGFIGSNFVNYWNAEFPDDFIVVYDKLTYAGNFNNLKDLQSKQQFKFIQADICDQEIFQNTIQLYEIDTIVHFAAETHVDRSISGPAEFIKTNIEGTYSILEVIKQNPHIRLHHISTDEVFGSLPLDNPQIKFKEITAYDPQSPYSASKASSDHLVRAYVNTYGLKATISNCSNNYGALCFPEKLIPLTITRAMLDQEIPVYGDGLQVRDWIHVYDHYQGIKLILKEGKLGETYLLGGNGERTNIWMVKKILEILNKPESLIVHVGDRLGHDRRYSIDFNKAQQELGFSPAKPVEQWLAETIKWYQDNKDWWLPLKPMADKIAEKYLTTR